MPAWKSRIVHLRDALPQEQHAVNLARRAVVDKTVQHLLGPNARAAAQQRIDDTIRKAEGKCGLHIVKRERFDEQDNQEAQKDIFHRTLQRLRGRPKIVLWKYPALVTQDPKRELPTIELVEFQVEAPKDSYILDERGNPYSRCPQFNDDPDTWDSFVSECQKYVNNHLFISSETAAVFTNQVLGKPYNPHSEVQSGIR